MCEQGKVNIGNPAMDVSVVDPLHHYRNLSERSPQPLIAVEGSTHLVRYVNPAFCRLAARTEEDLLGKPFALAVPESAENGCLALLDSVYRTGVAECLSDQKHRHPTSEPSYWSYMTWAILDADERPSGVMIQVTDTTQQTLAHQKLSLFSQTLLVSGLQQHELRQAAETGLQRLQRSTREIDHRAKNNLQIIVALLDMQIMESKAGISVDVLVQLRLHVQTVASFHDLLVHFGREPSEDSTLSAPTILHKLLPMWQKIIGEGEFRWSAEEVMLPVKQGMSLALLLNELLTNAVKHGGRQIELRLVQHENDVRLTVSDNGNGFPPAFDPTISAHFGLEFVENVVHLELRGTVTYTNAPDGGACVTVMFPLSTPSSQDFAAVPFSTAFEPSLLQATMRSFTALANSMQDHAILLLDEWANIVKWSLGAEQLFGYSEQEMLGNPVSKLYTPEEVTAGQITRELQQASRDGRVSEDRWMLRKNGSRFFAASILTALTGTNIRGFVKILRDTTEYKEAQEYQERRQVQIAVLRERARLAHELHDTLRQGLLGIERQLEEAQGVLGAGLDAHEPVKNYLARALDLTHRSLAKVQQAVQTVHSPLLQNADLATALRRLVDEANTSSAVRVELRIWGFPYLLPPELEDGLMRVGHEALLNTLQHAAATYIRFTLAFRPKEVELQVEDNGQGFDPASLPRSKSLGLRGMEQRIQHIGGSFSIESSRNAGTTMKATVLLA
ncbi:MAG: sensor signal transduction histidine kinase [Chthonomonadaceae bacterium]|nr:sensor signal transduction histidine kinase [Chthonomonadaceae bacterium]